MVLDDDDDVGTVKISLMVQPEIARFVRLYGGRWGSINFSKFFEEQVQSQLMGKIEPHKKALELRRKRDSIREELQAIEQQAEQVLGVQIDVYCAGMKDVVEEWDLKAGSERTKVWAKFVNQYRAQGGDTRIFRGWISGPAAKEDLVKIGMTPKEAIKRLVAEVGTVESFAIPEVSQ